MAFVSEVSTLKNPDEPVLRRRSYPCLVLLDTNFQVIDHDAQLQDLLGTLDLAVIGNRLPAPITRAVSHLILTARDCQPSDSALIVENRILVRATILVGPSNSCIAVTLEALRARDPISLAGKKFQLSAREMDILNLALSGDDSRSIARKLHISEYTVGEHFKHLYAKMGVTKRTALLAQVLDIATRQPCG